MQPAALGCPLAVASIPALSYMASLGKSRPNPIPKAPGLMGLGKTASSLQAQRAQAGGGLLLQLGRSGSPSGS